jgi:hypothetical protein
MPKTSAPAKPRKRIAAAPLIERQVRTLLAASPAYQQLPAESQRQISNNMVKIGTYLAEPESRPANQLPGALAIVPSPETVRDFLNEVNFPSFVATLINGVFQAIVDSSIRQMEAYGELLAEVAKSVDQFAKDAVNDEIARDWLTATYPDYLVRDTASGSLRPKPDFDRAMALRRFRLLPLHCPIRKLGPAEIESILVPAARQRVAASRQQLLATTVLMGVNR